MDVGIQRRRFPAGGYFTPAGIMGEIFCLSLLLVSASFTRKKVTRYIINDAHYEDRINSIFERE